MIIKELKAEFNEYFQLADAELILWLDRNLEWKGIIEHLRSDFKVEDYRGSQLEIKSNVELTWAKGETPKFILYLGGMKKESLTVLKEYEFSGKVFEYSILQAFGRWGVRFNQEEEDDLRKILPIAIRYYAEKDLSFWKENSTVEKLRAKLCDDESVRLFIADPERMLKELKESGRFYIFCEYIQDKFGGPILREDEEHKWPEKFASYLLLTEVRTKAGRPSSFPKFDIAPADDKHEENCLRFLRDWMCSSTYKDDFKRITHKLEQQYDLSLWAESLTSISDSESSLNVERVIEKKILVKIEKTKSPNELRELIDENFDSISQMKDHFWSREGEIVAWQALDTAGKIIKEIERCLNELPKADDASVIIKRYSETWWKIDQEYRSFRVKYDGEERLKKLSRDISALFRKYQESLNDRLLNLFEAIKRWEFPGIDSQHQFWENQINKSQKKRAVFLVDALRYDLAFELKERLEIMFIEDKIVLEPMISSVPTLTPIGMTAIIAGKDREAGLDDKGNWKITSSGSGNMAIKEERKKFLKKRHPKILFFELDDLLRSSDFKIDGGNPVVIFSKELDGVGHESGALNISLDFFGQYLEGLIKAIRRLTGLGIEEIYIASDHGFIILDDLIEADKIKVPDNLNVLYKGHRCLVGEDIPDKMGAIFGVAGSPKLKFVVPRGIGIFRKRGRSVYFHGGVSPQEMVIPFLKIAFRKAQPKYRVKIKAPEAIHNLIFDIELLRVMPGEGELFGAPRYVEVIGVLAKDAMEIFKQASPDLVINQLNDKLSVRLRIAQGIRFKYGDTLKIEVKDADTGELLDTAEIKIEVESDE